MNVCIGGTFNIIHKGHELMFETAFEGDSNVYIGLTTDEMVKNLKDVKIDSFEARNVKLHKFMIRKGWQDRYSIVKLEDRLGPATYMDFDVIVVSEKTRPNAEAINAEREKRGLKPLKIRTVKMALAENGDVISSTKIARREMDESGSMKREIVVSVGSENPVKLSATKNVFLKFYDKVQVSGMRIKSHVPEQPLEKDVIEGAVARCRQARNDRCDFAVGIEAGLFFNEKLGRYFDVQFCAIVDRAGRETYGHGSGFSYPSQVIEEVKGGKTVGQVMELLSGIPDVGRREGAIGYLSKGRLGRIALTEQAVMAAMIPRMRRELYGM